MRSSRRQRGETAFGASHLGTMFHDYSAVLLADCTCEVVGCDLACTNHEASLLLVEKRFGSVSTSEQFVKALQVTPTVSS